LTFTNEIIKRVGMDIEIGKEIDLSPDSLNDEEVKAHTTSALSKTQRATL
jgi:hypothetical protein